MFPRRKSLKTNFNPYWDLYITKCVKPARYFLNRMPRLLRNSVDKNTIFLDENFHRDRNRFNTILVKYNGVTFYDNQVI